MVYIQSRAKREAEASHETYNLERSEKLMVSFLTYDFERGERQKES